MKSNDDVIPFNPQVSEIKQLYHDITSHVATLDTKIKKEKNSLIVLQYKIDRWEDKKAVLEVALLCLSGDKPLAELNTAISDHPRWNDKNGWRQCNTEIFITKVKTLLTKPGLTASFRLSCFTNYFDSLLPEDIQLSLLVSFLPRPADVIHFAMTSKTNWGFFNTNISKIFLSSLLNHVALGEYEAAEKHYKHQKGILLTQKGNASYHYSYAGLTPYQIGLRNGEWIEVGKMGAGLSLEEKQEQFIAVYPDGKFVSGGCPLEKAKELIKKVFEAIIVDNDINETPVRGFKLSFPHVFSGNPSC